MKSTLFTAALPILFRTFDLATARNIKGRKLGTPKKSMMSMSKKSSSGSSGCGDAFTGNGITSKEFFKACSSDNSGLNKAGGHFIVSVNMGATLGTVDIELDPSWDWSSYTKTNPCATVDTRVETKNRRHVAT